MPTPPLPDDVLAYIVTSISNPLDLLSTSLTNRTLATFAKPGLAYHTIRCHLNKPNLWVHLVANPALAARVRELVILEDPSVRERLDVKERVPEDVPQLDSGTIDDGEKAFGGARSSERSEILLISALRFLVNLEKFTWDPLESDVVQGRKIPLELLQGGGHATETGIYKEDVWTALRDYTQLRKLKVVDSEPQWGERSPGITMSRMQPSKFWSIGNLTSLDLKIYYVPPREDTEANAGVGGDGEDNAGVGGDGEDNADVGGDGEDNANNNNNNNEDEDDTGLLPGRIDISALRALLLRCPNLEHLELAIFDQSFYHNQDGNPYTNLDSIFDPNPTYWPHLSTLRLEDVTIDNKAMTRFLVSHPHLRVLSIHLSLEGPDLPRNPFTLDGPTCEDFLPMLEEVALPPKPTRAVLTALSNPAGMKAVRLLEPRDWVAEEEYEDGEAELKELDDMWGEEEEEDFIWGMPGDRQTLTPDSGTHLEKSFLEGMTSLHTIMVNDVRTIDQLGRLADVTPQLEVVRVIGKGLSMNAYHSKTGFSLSELLSHLSKWQRLTIFSGIILWRGYDEKERETVEAVAAACPLLREVTWAGGKVGLLVRDEQGRGVRVDIIRPVWLIGGKRP